MRACIKFYAPVLNVAPFPSFPLLDKIQPVPVATCTYVSVHPHRELVATRILSHGRRFVSVTIAGNWVGRRGAGAPASDEISRSVSPGLSLKYPGYPITTKFESRWLIINHGLPSPMGVARLPRPVSSRSLYSLGRCVSERSDALVLLRAHTLFLCLSPLRSFYPAPFPISTLRPEPPIHGGPLKENQVINLRAMNELLDRLAPTRVLRTIDFYFKRR